MKKDVKAAAEIKSVVGKYGNVVEVLWTKWKVAFNKELTVQEISLEQPLIEDLCNDYLEKEIWGKIKTGPDLFRYVWKPPAQSSKAALKPNPSYTLEIFVNTSLLPENVSVPPPPGSIIKTSGKYKRGNPGSSSKNTVIITPPAV